MDILMQTYLADILHVIAQILLVPTIIALIALIVYALWCIGNFIFEWLREHRYFKVAMPEFMHQIDCASQQDLPQVIMDSGLLGEQKRCLLTLWDYRCLPVDAHVALAKRELAQLEGDHAKRVNRTQTVSKIAPMLGLMGTLIPLGPGLVSLGVGDTLTLSSSLLVAFDTTVAGLVVSLVTYVITKVRVRWYESYMNTLEASVMALLEKVDNARENGTLDVDEPTHYADAFPKYTEKQYREEKKQQRLAKKAAKEAEAQKKQEKLQAQMSKTQEGETL